MTTILNAQLKAELEQVRDRLLSDQTRIVQTTIAQTEAQLDRTLQQINLLLGSSVQATEVTEGAKAETASQPKQLSSKLAITTKHAG
ncbi:hypothetical protein [Phormidesmis priestleyi]